jgi:hypothetical protein
VPTIADNVESMAALVAKVKKDHHLSEATVLRIVDMNFALAQESGNRTFAGDEELPFDGDGYPTGEFPADMVDPDGNPLMFPASPEQIDAVEDDETDTLTIVTPPTLEN